ncbi:MAG TPA: hypothetical protein VNS10_21830 [Gemmatimonadaceae bacterium]|jgi:hypothetical protein|nr:hypothetical protein [Gemmatimonadaceae bacterium]
MRSQYIIAVAAIALSQAQAIAQTHNHPKLHVNPRWEECSFQLDPSLTQAAWHQFTQEAGLVSYFRPLAAARPMGRGKFEVSMVQWQTNIDDSAPAWNDTFVHPDSMHWLFEGKGLKFPGLMARVGVAAKTDVAVYLTKNPGANYGFYGAQVQQNLVDDASRGWSASARASFIKIYGPEDLDFTTYGADVVASKRLTITKWISVSPYAGVSSYLAISREKSALVNLSSEQVIGGLAMVGTEVQLSKARLAVEYDVSRVNSLSLKVGVGR